MGETIRRSLSALAALTCFLSDMLGEGLYLLDVQARDPFPDAVMAEEEALSV